MKKIQETAKEIFEANENLDKLFVTPSGKFFSSENLAENTLEKGETLTILTRVEIEKKQENTKGNPTTTK